MFIKKCLLVCVIIAAFSVSTLGAQSAIAESGVQPGLGTATYKGLKPDGFMTRWLVLGPIPVFEGDPDPNDDKSQKDSFDLDPFSLEQFQPRLRVGEDEYEWAFLHSEDDIVDLVHTFGEKEYVIAYAWAQIDMPDEKSVILGIGSDDAVKVWLNGTLVHENLIQRSITRDSDFVPVTFKKGENQLVLKIQNGISSWQFSCRLLGPDSLAKKLIAAAKVGNLDDIEMLLENGADVNAKIGPGLTALHVARIDGREDAIKLLLEKGADTNIEMPPKNEVVDWSFERIIKEKYPGAAVIVAQDGQIVYQKGFGYANIEHRVPVSPETKFRIGSITKQFTAAAILKLQEEGKLSIEDKLSKFIPDYPRGDEVTIHHLLTHTSGIHSYTSKPDFMKTVTVEIKPDELIDSFKNDKFDFDPGEKQMYNNSGYFLLGYIVEKVSGKSFGDYLKETFFDPLDMKDTDIHHWSLILDHEATGYSYIGGKVQKAINWDMSRAGGAGALYSTVGDLYRWNEALFNGKLLKESSLKAAFTPARLNDGSIGQVLGESGYGYGLVMGEIREMKLLSHGGGLQGFNSYLMRLPEKNFTIAVLANCLPQTPEMGTSALAHNIAAVHLFEQMAKQVSIKEDKTIDSKIYDDYVGRYDYGNSAVLIVTKEGDRLLAQLTSQPKLEIFPRSESEFFWKVVDAQITFVRNEKGKVTHAIHHQGGRTLKAPKLKDEPVAEIDPAVYDKYLGEYDIENVGTLKVTKENGHLYSQMAGQPRVEMFPRSETEFFFKIVNAQITFVKDNDGKITSLILKQAGMTMTGKKTE